MSPPGYKCFDLKHTTNNFASRRKPVGRFWMGERSHMSISLCKKAVYKTATHIACAAFYEDGIHSTKVAIQNSVCIVNNMFNL